MQLMCPQTITVKVLSIVPISVIFATRLIHFFWNCLYNQCSTNSNASFLKVQFSHVTCSNLLVLNHNIPKMIVCKRKQNIHDFLECTVVVNLPTLAIPINLQHVAMCWPRMNDSWVIGVSRTLNCKVEPINYYWIVQITFQQQFCPILSKNPTQNTLYLCIL
jgi:hypothetical protein